MTENTTVKKQLEAIEKSTKQALQSKASALQFLRDAGIGGNPASKDKAHRSHPPKKH